MGTIYNIQPDQINMVVLFWYLVISVLNNISKQTRTPQLIGGRGVQHVLVQIRKGGGAGRVSRCTYTRIQSVLYIFNKINFLRPDFQYLLYLHVYTMVISLASTRLGRKGGGLPHHGYPLNIGLRNLI